MKNKKILIVDYGGIHIQNMARKIRDLHVYSEIIPYHEIEKALKDEDILGLILAGEYTEAKNRPIDNDIIDSGLPVLAVDYGLYELVKTLGGGAEEMEGTLAPQEVELETDNSLFKGLDETGREWVNGRYNVHLPKNFESIAHVGNKTVAIKSKDQNFYGIQFHPELTDSAQGEKILKNFLFDICGADGEWNMKNYAAYIKEQIKDQVGDDKVLLALSGGVDSSVCAKLISDAIGSQLTCIFVDHGLMRKNEGKEVQAAFKDSGMNLIAIDGEASFLEKLKGVTDPEQKRKIIGEEFIRVFEEEGKKVGKVDYLAQGTIYPDVIESGVVDGQTIKSHHNVGGLPSVVEFKDFIEPLRHLFKDEVRQLGLEIGLDETLVWRQPFPGPGLGIRVMGELTKEKLDILRDADYIYREELGKAGLTSELGQYFAVLTNNRTVGVRDGKRTYDYTLALRAVKTDDFMTAHIAHLPFDVLETVVNRITSEVSHINRVVYDITGKPPGTIEWE